MSPEDVIKAAAQAAHEANRAWCSACGDHSQAPWESAPVWQRDSAIAGVRVIVSDPETKPATLHVAWWQNKIADGWTYGTVKEPTRKLHPCMVPYEQLPPEQRAKDAIFHAVVRSILKAGGLIP